MFIVTEIISGDEIIVEPNWLWEGFQGKKVIVFGYKTPKHHMPGYEFAINKLKEILQGKQVELKDPQFFPNSFGYDKLVCRVYLNGVDIANYFPEFKSNSFDLKKYTG